MIAMKVQLAAIYNNCIGQRNPYPLERFDTMFITLILTSVLLECNDSGKANFLLVIFPANRQYLLASIMTNTLCSSVFRPHTKRSKCELEYKCICLCERKERPMAQ